MSDSGTGFLCFSKYNGSLCFSKINGALIYKGQLGDIVLTFSSFPKTYTHYSNNEHSTKSEEPLNVILDGGYNIGHWEKNVIGVNLANGNIIYTLLYNYIPNVGSDTFTFYPYTNYTDAGNVTVSVTATQAGGQTITKDKTISAAYVSFNDVIVTIGESKRLENLTIL